MLRRNKGKAKSRNAVQESPPAAPMSPVTPSSYLRLLWADYQLSWNSNAPKDARELLRKLGDARMDHNGNAAVHFERALSSCNIANLLDQLEELGMELVTSNGWSPSRERFLFRRKK